MQGLSFVAIGIFVAGYSTARWDLVTRLYELAIFAWDHGVVWRAVQGVAALSALFVLVYLPIERIASHAANLHPRAPGCGISAREQLKRRGSF
ncbi:hypothetical protein BU23DRAFT_464615 [Bimuria novae-zelandiae CBS 107.79]|uniref:Phosphatidylinositol glycan, class Q n=1 Tax=Bimuria novae-zelandiae CBS 107.79 TaxID=1447943 RepID=A0A6A5V7Q8_9PLEO|nr:hypothetical protein BU23DRAFT_464615 [Bimuria novae-zelandiae CBS 107.79]